MFISLKKEAKIFNDENSGKNMKKIVKFVDGNPQIFTIKNSQKIEICSK